MKILFLTVSDQQHHPLNKYSDLHCTFDFKSWESGFRAITSDLQIVDCYASFVCDGPLGMENRIRNEVKRNRVQLLIVPNLYYEIAPAFLSELRVLGCRSMIVFFDDSTRFDDTNRFYLNSFDYYLTHESKDSAALYRPFGIDAEFFPNLPSHTFYSEIIQRLNKSPVEDSCDVVFVGAKIADRNKFICHLCNNNINVGVYGRGWETGMLSTEKMIAALNSSKISLNFVKSIDVSGRVQLKGRIFEIIMAGGFVLSEHSDELKDYFDIGREIDTFQSPSELLDKVKFYLGNSTLREEMAARAKEKVERIYSFESYWRRYLADIKNGIIKTAWPKPEYKVPSAAVDSFLNWNRALIYGRFMLGQYRLAYQQYKFCKRELKTLESNIAIIKLDIKRRIKSCVRLVLSRNQIHSIKKLCSRRSQNDNAFLLEVIIGRALPTYLDFSYHELMVKTLNFVESMKLGTSGFEYECSRKFDFKNYSSKTTDLIEVLNSESKFKYRYAPSVSQPTIYGSIYACLLYFLLNKQNGVSFDDRTKWISYFDGFQREDGMFIDSALECDNYYNLDWWGAGHLSLHLIICYTYLGSKPKYEFNYIKKYYDHDVLKHYLNSLELENIKGVDSDNAIMNLGSLLQYQRDFFDDKKAGETLLVLFEELEKRINSKTGSWGCGADDDKEYLSRTQQFAYHLYPLWLYDNREIKYKEKLIDLTLALQNVFGGFSPKLNSSACEDIDAIDLLIKLSVLSDYRRSDIEKALKKAFVWVLANQNEDGGFVFRLNEPFVYGHPLTSSLKNESHLFATWFRTLSIAYLTDYLEIENDFNIGHCPGLQFKIRSEKYVKNNSSL